MLWLYGDSVISSGPGFRATVFHLGIVDLYVSILSNSRYRFTPVMGFIGNMVITDWIAFEGTVPGVSFAANTGRMRGGVAQRRMSLQISLFSCHCLLPALLPVASNEEKSCLTS